MTSPSPTVDNTSPAFGRGISRLSSACIGRPGLAFLSRSCARLELDLLTVHSFTPRFRKAVQAVTGHPQIPSWAVPALECGEAAAGAWTSRAGRKPSAPRGRGLARGPPRVVQASLQEGAVTGGAADSPLDWAKATVCLEVQRRSGEKASVALTGRQGLARAAWLRPGPRRSLSLSRRLPAA